MHLESKLDEIVFSPVLPATQTNSSTDPADLKDNKKKIYETYMKYRTQSRDQKELAALCVMGLGYLRTTLHRLKKDDNIILEFD